MEISGCIAKDQEIILHLWIEKMQFWREKPKFRVQSDSRGMNECDSWDKERFVVYVIDHKL